MSPYAAYVAVAGQRDFDVPFPFLSPTHVEVRANGIRYYPSEWINGTRLRLQTAPGAGAFVELTRNTPIDQALVQFQNGAVLTQEDLNTAVQQVLFKQQELVAFYDRTLLAARVRIGEAGGVAITPEDAANQIASMIAADQVLADFRQRITDLDVSAETILSQSLWNLETHQKNEASIRELVTQRLSDTEAFAQKITELTSVFDHNIAQVHEELTTVSNAQSAQATRLETLGTLVGDAQAAVVAEQKARSDAISAEAKSRESLAARVGDVEGTVQSEAKARVDADGAFTELWSLLGSKSPDGKAFVLSDSTARMSNGQALATYLSGLDTRLKDNSAAIVDEQKARSDAVGAQAERITTVNTTVGRLSSSVSTISESVNGLAGRYGVQLDVNGYITGYVMNNDGRTGDFTVGVDVFRVINRVNGEAVFPFIVRDGKVFINEAYISDLHADKITAGTLSVDRLLYSSIGSDKFAIGAVGEASAVYNDTALIINTNNWTDVVRIALTPVRGMPINGQFNVTLTNLSKANGQGYVRVLRDDGTSVWGGSNGSYMGWRDEGTVMTVNFFDVVDPNRPTTYVLQLKRTGDSDITSIKSRVAWVQELSRLHFQQFEIINGGSLGAGGGPGGGGGGGTIQY